MAKTKLPKDAAAFLKGQALQRYNDTKKALLEALNYDRISQTTYNRKLAEARATFEAEYADIVNL